MTSALPIDAVLPELMEALARTCRAVLEAPPGAGKTTRVPLALLEAPWRGDGTILVLEPRRLAARAAARRMARTLDEEVGETVGYRVRLDTKIGPKTRIEMVTEGIFVRKILDDPELSGVAAVVFDEFHERSLDADLGLALALDATALREDLRILVMSATLDGARVARLLGGAPVVRSEGRAFPVETRYRPLDAAQRLEDGVAGAVRQAVTEETGSALVFLPGEGEIARVAERLAGRLPEGIEIAPLYGRLTGAEQDRAIRPAPAGRRKIVLATAIAQTSLTIEGVRIVVDAGFSRGPAFSPATGLTRLETRRVSLASADQRRGRAGRTEPGICYRLWHEGQTGSLLPFDPPEMLVADLAGLALDLASWGVGDPGALRFLDPPPEPAWREAGTLLEALGALDSEGRITAHGRALARMPLHPRLAHMIAAAPAGEKGEAALLAAVLSERGAGGTGLDLSHRVERLLRDGSGAAQGARKLAAGWAGTGAVGISGATGRHLALAYPERVAQRAGARGRFRLANGRAGRIAETEALADAPFLAVAEIDGGSGDGRIRSAAALTREEIEAAFGARIETGTVVGFDKAAGAVRARRRRMLGALVLEDSPMPVPDGQEAARLLARAAADRGIDRLPWSRGQTALRGKVGFLRKRLGEDWPDVSDAGLAAGAEIWLAPQLSGVSGLAGMSAAHLEAGLATLVPWGRRAEIDALLPGHFAVPSGSHVPIDYGAGETPVLAVRVQELFGLDRHPAVGGGKIPLLVVLLSPAHRPIQTTADLPGFWRGSWKEVAREMKGRYPRHPWPDDPLSAAATSRAKPRK